MEGRGVKKCTFALKMKLLSDFQRLCVDSSIRVSVKSTVQHFYILVPWKLTTELMLFRCVLTVSAFLKWPIYSFHIICLFFFLPIFFPKYLLILNSCYVSHIQVLILEIPILLTEYSTCIYGLFALDNFSKVCKMTSSSAK